MASLLKKFWRDGEGQGLSEYALLFVLIVLAAVTTMRGLATRVGNAYADTSAHVSSATNSPFLAGGSLSYTAMGPSYTRDQSRKGHEKKPRD